MTERIPNEELINEIHRLADGPNDPPSGREMATEGSHGTTTYAKRFGSWNNALRAAGYTPNRERDITKEDLLEEIHRLADGNGDPPTASDMEKNGKFGTTTYSSYFGTWNEALRAGGYLLNKEINISDEDLLDEIHRLADGPNSPPVEQEMITNGNYAPNTYKRRWESWNEALQAAGYTPHHLNNISVESLLNEIHRLSDGVNNPPTETEMADHGKYSPNVYHNRLGSWNEALQAAGYQLNRATDISEKELKNEIHRLADDADTPPSRRQMIDRGDYSQSAYRNQWGSWNKAVQAAGYSPNQEQNIDKESLLGEILRLRDELDRTPTFAEMDKFGNYSSMAYRYKFHSWWAAVVKSGCKPHSRHPLSPEAVHRFYNESVSRKNKYPTQSLVGLLLQFTGVTVSILTALSSDWLRMPADDLIISVPNEYTASEQYWEFRVPETWHNPFTDNRESTQLPGLLEWYFTEYDNLEFDTHQSIRQYTYDIARDANLSELRDTIRDQELGKIPKVRPSDLRTTHGVHLAQRGAPSDLIERRLGLQHTNTDMDIEEFYIWLEARRDTGDSD